MVLTDWFITSWELVLMLECSAYLLVVVVWGGWGWIIHNSFSQTVYYDSNKLYFLYDNCILRSVDIAFP